MVELSQIQQMHQLNLRHFYCLVLLWVQIIKVSPKKSNLNLTKMIWIRPKWFAPDQNNLYPSKTIWTYRRARHKLIEICEKKRLERGHRELLDGRLCRPDSEQWPWTGNLCTMTIVKFCWHNFTQSAYFMIFFVSSISYRPTDLSLLKEFSKNVSFWNSYKLPSQSAFQKISMSTTRETLMFSIKKILSTLLTIFLSKYVM